MLPQVGPTCGHIKAHGPAFASGPVADRRFFNHSRVWGPRQWSGPPLSCRVIFTGTPFSSCHVGSGPDSGHGPYIGCVVITWASVSAGNATDGPIQPVIRNDNWSNGTIRGGRIVSGGPLLEACLFDVFPIKKSHILLNEAHLRKKSDFLKKNIYASLSKKKKIILTELF